MYNLVKNELFKIFKQKKLYICGVMILVVLAISIASAIMTQSASSSSGNLLVGSESADVSSQVTGQNFPISMISSISTILVIYIVILLGDIMADEYKSGTLKLTLLGPVSRSKVVMAKAIALFISISTLIVFTLITSYIAGSIFFDWGSGFNVISYQTTYAGEMTAANFALTAVLGILVTAGAFLLTILPYFSFGMIVYFLSTLIPNMGAVIGASLGTWITMSLVGMAFPKITPYLITSYFSFYNEFLRSSKDFDVRSIATGSLVIVLTGALFLGLSIFAIRKKDILA